MANTGPGTGAELTRWQRMALRRLVKAAGKRHGEPLEPDDWAAYFAVTFTPSSRVLKRLLHSLPTSPRCGICGAPFAGFGGRLVRPLGYHPSRKKPNICATCVELAPPGGMTMNAGVLFADIRGFTALSAESDPEGVSRLLRRFYSCAESVLFPVGLIDKLIGDQVMAPYLPLYQVTSSSDEEAATGEIAKVMISHAQKLLERVGYGAPDGPFVEVGVGLDLGEAFVGNIGEGALHDFTAVGDVVNTAARLQAAAGSGEILISGRLANELKQPPGEREDILVKGKTDPVEAYRVTAER